jgi:hypothetical protein
MITKVNSDKEIEELLDANGQLKLRTPMNIYIGGKYWTAASPLPT